MVSTKSVLLGGLTAIILGSNNIANTQEISLEDRSELERKKMRTCEILDAMRSSSFIMENEPYFGQATYSQVADLYQLVEIAIYRQKEGSIIPGFLTYSYREVDFNLNVFESSQADFLIMQDVEQGIQSNHPQLIIKRDYSTGNVTFSYDKPTGERFSREHYNHMLNVIFEDLECKGGLRS